MLGICSVTYALALPLVLPVVSLIAALQRDKLLHEEHHANLEHLGSSMQRDGWHLTADARAAIEEMRKEIRGSSLSTARLANLDAKLAALEGSVLSAGRAAREASQAAGALPERFHREGRAQYEAIVGALRVELRRTMEVWNSEEATALSRLDTRLAAVEGSLTGLEVAQSEGLRRISMNLTSALTDAESSLQAAVRNEVAASMDPVRRLPQMLAATLPQLTAVAAAQQQQQQQQQRPGRGGDVALLGDGGGGAVAGVDGAAAAQAALVQQLQAVMAQELEGAVRRVLDAQAESAARLVQVRPMQLEEEQWTALGRRLTRLERLLESVPEAAEQRLQPQLAAARQDVAAARDEVAALTVKEADALRADVSAAQAAAFEGVEQVLQALGKLREGLASDAREATRGTSPSGTAAGLDISIITDLLHNMGGKLDTVSSKLVALQDASVAAATAAAVRYSVSATGSELATDAATADGSDSVAAVAASSGQAAAAAAATVAVAQLEEVSGVAAALQRTLEDVRSTCDGLTARVAQLDDSATADRRSAVAAGEMLGRIEELAAKLESLARVVPNGVSDDEFAPEAAFDDDDVSTQTAAAAAGASTAGEGAALLDVASGVSGVQGEFASSEPPITAPPAQSSGALFDDWVRGRSGSSSSAPEQQQAAEAGADNNYQLGDGGDLPFQEQQQLDASSFNQPLLSGQQQQDNAGQQYAQEQGSNYGAYESGYTQGDSMLSTSYAPLPSNSFSQVDEQRPLWSGADSDTGYQIGTPPDVGQTPVASGSSSNYNPQQPPNLQPEPLQYGSDRYADASSAGESSNGSNYVAEQYGSSSGAGDYVTDQHRTNSGAADYSLPSVAAQPAPQGLQSPSAGSYPQYDAAADTSYSRPPGDGGARYAGDSQGSYYDAPRPPAGPLPAGDNGYAPAGPYQEAPAASIPAVPDDGYQQADPRRQRDYVSRETDNRAAWQQQQLQLQPPWSGEAPRPEYEQQEPAAAVDPSSLDPQSMSSPDLLLEGLRLLRAGRAETRAARDYGAADTLLRGAAGCFEAAAERTPDDSKALGNLGNALLALGELKRALLAEVAATGPVVGRVEREALARTAAQLRSDSAQLLTRAGELFKAVLELDGWSSRALVNWGRAMCIRAELVDNPTVSEKLFQAAIDKFEAVLEEDREMVPAKYRCAIALKGLARCKPAGSREASILLQDACNYLQDVLASDSPDAAGLKEAAAGILDECAQQLTR